MAGIWYWEGLSGVQLKQETAHDAFEENKKGRFLAA